MISWLKWRLANRRLNLVLKKQEKIMSALEDLKNEVAKAVASMNAAAAAIGSQNDSAQLADLTSQLATAKGALDTALSSVTAPAS